MSAETIVAAVAVLISIVSLGVAIVQTRKANGIAHRSSTAAERAANASEQQTRIQEVVSRQAADPYVWVDIRPDDQKGGLLLLVVGNSGPTVATNVVVEFDPPLRDAPLPKEVAAQLGEQRLNAGLASLPPGRIVYWSLGAAFAPFNINGFPMSYAVEITATGPFGSLEPLSYNINLDDMRNHLVSAAPGTLYGVTHSIDQLGEAVKKIERHTKNLSRTVGRNSSGSSAEDYDYDATLTQVEVSSQEQEI